MIANDKAAELVQAGLEDPMTLAFVKIVGALRGLPSDRARRRVLDFVKDHLDERHEAEMRMPGPEGRYWGHGKNVEAEGAS